MLYTSACLWQRVSENEASWGRGGGGFRWLGGCARMAVFLGVYWQIRVSVLTFVMHRGTFSLCAML